MKKQKYVFLIIVILIFIIPLFTSKEGGSLSTEENRMLSTLPRLTTSDGTINKIFPSQFEEWANDNVGIRQLAVKSNALIQYYVFHNLTSADMYLGSQNELNYATSEMLQDYQHLNLYSQDELQYIAQSHQKIADWLAHQNICYIYMQCYDKHSIYPEYFMDTVNQYGTESKTDQLISTLENNCTFPVVSTKDALLSEKQKNAVYSVWGDPTHWNAHGAYIGYRELMQSLQSVTAFPLTILQETDYTIKTSDQGYYLNGIIHEVDFQKSYFLKKNNAFESDKSEYLGEFSSDERNHVWLNPTINNGIRLLIVGDSYIEQYILDDIAESFSVTMFIQADYTKQLNEIVSQTTPDIVIYECAERCDRSALINFFADCLKNN